MRSPLYACLLLPFVLAFAVPHQARAQMEETIKNKVLDDKQYTNAWIIGPLKQTDTPDADRIRNMWGCLASKRMKEGGTYYVYFTMDPDRTNIYPLLVKEDAMPGKDTTAGEDMFARRTRNAVAPSNYYNYFNDPTYTDLQAFILEMVRRGEYKPRPYFYPSIVPDTYSRTETTNRDQLEYLKINSNHSLAEKITLAGGTNARTGALATTITTVGTKSYLDMSFTHAPVVLTSLSFSERNISWKALGLKGFGLELAQGEDRILNMLPIQTPYISIGGRILLDFSDTSHIDLDSSFFLDTKILVRHPVNVRSWIERNKLNRSKSVMYIGLPNMNIGSGVTIDMSTSKIPFGGRLTEKLPVMNLYASFGIKGFSDPAFITRTPLENFTYFSDNQWEVSTSFFWKVDQNGYNRFKIDIGAGGYDIIKVGYDDKMHTTSTREMVWLTSPQFMMAVNYSHQSSNTGYGVTLRAFDNRINSLLWMKILQNAIGGELRVEYKFISPLLGRLQRPWETNGGSIVQLRYRTGF